MEIVPLIFAPNLINSKLIWHQVRRISSWKRIFRKYDVVSPWNKTLDVSQAQIPDHIVKPSYSKSGIPQVPPRVPEKLSSNELQALRRSCKLAADILKSLKKFIQVGVTTENIDKEVHRLSIENEAYPSPLNYNHFPKSCCTSVNNVACHGIPDSRPLVDGDIVNVDITVFREGVHGDCSCMFLIGDVDDDGRKLCTVARDALDAAVKICRPGVPFSQIGDVIEDHVKGHQLTVIPCFTGHGIGTYFHGPPDIYHFRNEIDDGKMEEGMCFTIEPVIGDGSAEILILEDDWTAVTVDNSRTAQYEHTVLITKQGAEILTPYHLP